MVIIKNINKLTKVLLEEYQTQTFIVLALIMFFGFMNIKRKLNDEEKYEAKKMIKYITFIALYFFVLIMYCIFI